jgi:hypothetical protein
MRVVVLTAMLSSCWMGVGCQQSRVNISSFQRESFHDTPFNDVFKAARRSVQERFLIVESDPSVGVLRANSRDFGDVSDGGHVISDALGLGRRHRHDVTVRLRRADETVEVYCQVLVQENVTDSVRMLHREHSIEDQPLDTPADRDAGTTRQQNAAWKNIRRDRELERQILGSINDILRP